MQEYALPTDQPKTTVGLPIHKYHYHECSPSADEPAAESPGVPIGRELAESGAVRIASTTVSRTSARMSSRPSAMALVPSASLSSPVSRHLTTNVIASSELNSKQQSHGRVHTTHVALRHEYELPRGHTTTRMRSNQLHMTPPGGGGGGGGGRFPWSVNWA